jgi:autotransporter-associated beta strand protein
MVHTSLNNPTGDSSDVRCMHFRIALLAILIGAVVTTTSAPAQTTYVWNDSTTSWTAATAWTPNGPADWNDASRITDALASFGSRATIVNQPNIDNNVSIRGISIDDSQAWWNISRSFGAFNLGADGVTVMGTGTNQSELATKVNLVLPQTWTIGEGMTLDATDTISGSSDFTKAGAGTLFLASKFSDFTGAVTIAGGTLYVKSLADGGTNSALGASSAAASNLRFQGPGATLIYNGAGESTNRQFTVSQNGATILSIGDGPVNFTSTTSLTYSGSGARTLTLGGHIAGKNYLAAPIADGPGGATSITKTGDATWILIGDATYKGVTTINGGVLGLKGDRSATTGTVYVNAGYIEIADGTKLGGNIVVAPDTGFQASQGGTAAAQTNSPAVFGDSPEESEIMGDMTFEEGADVGFELKGSQPETGYDRLDIDGNVSLGNAILDLGVRDFSPNIGDAYFIINNKGNNPIAGQFANAPEGSILTSNGHSFQITYFADTDTHGLTGGNDVALVAVATVPEPTTSLLLMLAVSGWCLGRRRAA